VNGLLLLLLNDLGMRWALSEVDAGGYDKTMRGIDEEWDRLGGTLLRHSNPGASPAPEFPSKTAHQRVS
jgi:hypothetical protein